jgi:hypothetical protein
MCSPPDNNCGTAFLIMELIAVTIAPILRISSNRAKIIMRFCLIVVARVDASAVGRAQLTMVVIEDVKTTAATALTHALRCSRNRPIRSLCHTQTVVTSEQGTDDQIRF